MVRLTRPATLAATESGSIPHGGSKTGRLVDRKMESPLGVLRGDWPC